MLDPLPARRPALNSCPASKEASIDSPTNHPAIAPYLQSAPARLDLTDSAHLALVVKAAEALLETFGSAASLADLETRLAADRDRYPLLVHLAAKLARSKRLVAAVAEPVHLTIVFAVYKEHHRIRTRDEHPHGENFLLRKIAQLNWLFGDLAQFSWDMLIVDDGDPEKSGEIAQEILASHYDGDNVRVLFLEEAIREGLAVTHPMTDAAESQKGGSIAYGLWAAAQADHPRHIIMFTDADLSTHLGQTGLLIDGLLHQGKAAAIGSRREATSIVVKEGTRNLRGKLFIYLWKRLIADLYDVVDSQCGFKAFTADTVRAIVDDLIEKKFAFDIELLLKTELRQPGAIVKVPIAWIDSTAESTTTDLQPYLSMLQSIVKMYRKYLPSDPEAESFAQFIESLDEDTWDRLVDHVPPAIADRDPAEFGDFNQVRVSDLEAAIRE